MKKTLLILFALLTFIGGANAQEVTFDFTTNDWGIPTSKTSTATEYTANGYTIKLEGTTGNKEGYAYYTSGTYVLLGKKGATLTFPAFDFDVEKIEVVGRTGASTSVKQNIYVGETAVSTETTGATATQTYEIATDYQAAGNIYVLKVTSGHNTQFTAIKIYKKGATTLEDAGLKFSQDSYTIEKGVTEFTAPTFTKATDAAVSFSSSNTDVATVSTEGVISLAGATGTATITASSEATDTYKAGTATVTIKVYEASLYKKATAVESGKEYAIIAFSGETPIAAANLSGNYGYLQVASSRSTTDGVYVEKGNGFVIETTDGGYTIKQASNDKYLYMTGTYNSFNVNATPTDGQVWTIEAQSDGTFKITNVAMTKYIQYSAGYTSYGSYTSETGILPCLYVLGEATGINTIAAEKAIDENAPLYNLAGQRVGKNFKGVVIQNGKKMILK